MGNTCASSKATTSSVKQTSFAPPKTESLKEIEDRKSDNGENELPVLTPWQLAAVTRIQRLVKQRSAWRIAQAEREWKIFSDLDTQDEADMLNLAVFMQTLLDWVPGEQKHDSTKQFDSVNMDDDDAGGIDLDTIKLTGVGSEQVYGNINDFVLPKGSLDGDCAQKIIEVYRNNGRLNIKSIQKILRVVYKSLKDYPNISRVNIKKGDKLTVVGDLHGQLGDLFHILDESGWPSEQNKYIFNGDFVDRGEQGVEVVCCLLALQAALPQYVYLNRGNHEDHAICCVYGFQNECKQKYDELTFGMFVEVFRHLPLFAIVNDSVFVVHGGLFHNVNTTLEDLACIERSDYTAKAPIPYPECTNGMSPSEARREYLKQLQRDALWSDPSDLDVLAKNQRGSGVVFGPEVVKKFLNNNKLHMIVRSHECVRRGFDQPFSGLAKHTLCTIFSASNYCGGQNDAAYLVFSIHRMSGSIDIPGSELKFTVHHFNTSEAQASLVAHNNMSLHELILRKRKALLQAFESADTESTGKISKSTWAEIMPKVTKLKILWLPTLKAIAPNCVHGNSVDYKDFLNSFGTKSDSDEKESVISVDEMYGQRKQLEAIFHFFDKDGSGAISREEFKLGCDFLNTTLPPEQQLRDYDHVLNLMDFDQSDSIDINEFFEVFRILDAKDGAIDGVLSVAQGGRN